MQQTVSTMTPLQMVVALFEKAELETTKAIYYIEQNSIEKANNSIKKVESMFDFQLNYGLF